MPSSVPYSSKNASYQMNFEYKQTGNSTSTQYSNYTYGANGNLAAPAFNRSHTTNYYNPTNLHHRAGNYSYYKDTSSNNNSRGGDYSYLGSKDTTAAN